MFREGVFNQGKTLVETAPMIQSGSKGRDAQLKRREPGEKTMYGGFKPRVTTYIQEKWVCQKQGESRAKPNYRMGW